MIRSETTLLLTDHSVRHLQSTPIMANSRAAIRSGQPVFGVESSPLVVFFQTVIVVVVAAFICWLLRNQTVVDLSFLLPMAAIAIASMLGGLIPGVVATVVLAGLANHFDPLHRPLIPLVDQVKWLIEGGLLMSVVSGQVHSAQRRARASNAATIDLERKVLEVSDEERRRIGHDLHDGLGQHLTGISLLSTSLANRIARSAPDASADAAKISTLVTQSIGWTRDLARGLSPVTLEDEGLWAALEELADNAQDLLNIECTLEFDGEEPAIDTQRAMHVFRIVQEAVSNSVKHGKAKLVKIDVQAKGNTLTARVTDNGNGLSEKTRANPGLGLRIMEYRARMVGATLDIQRITLAADRITPSSGTIVTVRCPLPAATAASRTALPH